MVLCSSWVQMYKKPFAYNPAHLYTVVGGGVQRYAPPAEFFLNSPLNYTNGKWTVLICCSFWRQLPKGFPSLPTFSNQTQHHLFFMSLSISLIYSSGFINLRSMLGAWPHYSIPEKLFQWHMERLPRSAPTLSLIS